MPELPSLPPAFWLGGSLLFGLVVGSFLNVLIHRLPRMLERDWQEQCADLDARTLAPQPTYNLLTPASSCPACGHRIRPWENIPIISYLMLRGRCAGCGTHISARYPLVELLTGLLSLALVWQLGPGSQAAASLLLLWGLVALTFIDYDTQLLPDQITLPLLWLGLLLNISGLFTDLSSAVIGAAAGYLSLWLVFQLFRLLTGKEGMGYGDFKLLALFGAWLGWAVLPQIVLLSSLFGAVVGISLILFGKHAREHPIPFGPYLAAAGLVALLWGDRINQAYLDFAGL